MRSWPLLLLALALIAPAGAKEIGSPITLTTRDLPQENRFMKVRLLGSLALNGDPALAELSALAWDEDEQILYAVTDRGWLLHLAPRFEAGRLTGVSLLASHRLRDRLGKPLTGRNADSEGLVLERGDNGIRGDSRLLISFERHHRILRFDPLGHAYGALPLPPPLDDPRRYATANRGIEGFTLHPSLGLIAAAESPLRGDTLPRLVSSEASWFYRPNRPAGRIVAMESEPGGSLLILERAFISPLQPWTLSLTRLRPDRDNRGSILQGELLVEFDSGKGWLVQNLEGMSRHRENRYFLVSDDNGKPWAQTQLIYLELAVGR